MPRSPSTTTSLTSASEATSISSRQRAHLPLPRRAHSTPESARRVTRARSSRGRRNRRSRVPPRVSMHVGTSSPRRCHCSPRPAAVSASQPGTSPSALPRSSRSCEGSSRNSRSSLPHAAVGVCAAMHVVIDSMCARPCEGRTAPAATPCTAFIADTPNARAGSCSSPMCRAPWSPTPASTST